MASRRPSGFTRRVRVSAARSATPPSSATGSGFPSARSPSRPTCGRIVPTTVDADVVKMQENLAGIPFAFAVDPIEPLDRISVRWHPSAIEPGVDYFNKPMTWIAFEREDADGGTRSTVAESGFDRIPIERRAKVFAANDVTANNKKSRVCCAAAARAMNGSTPPGEVAGRGASSPGPDTRAMGRRDRTPAVNLGAYDPARSPPNEIDGRNPGENTTNGTRQ